MSSDDGVIEAITNARHNIALAQGWAGNLDYKTFRDDVMRRYAIQYAFIVIGEALKDIPRPLLELHGPDIPWRKVVGFRDWLAHTYDDLPDPRIIGTLREDLPSLDRVLVRILEHFETQKSRK